MDRGLPDGQPQRQDAGKALKLHTAEERAAFIRANTALINPPHVPEIRLQLADEVHELWLKTESELEELGLPPPFWAFAWAGGQGLARHVLDHPEIVRGKHVIDLATGSGIVAIAAAMAGAAHVTANDIDPFCGAAVKMNAHANGVSVEYRQADYISGEPLPPCDVLLAGDVFYDRAMAEGCMAMLRKLAAP